MTNQIECTHWDIFNNQHELVKSFGGLVKSQKRTKSQLSSQAFKLLRTVNGSFAVLMNGVNPVQDFDTPCLVNINI